MLTDLSINPQQETDRITEFIKNTLEKTGFKRLVIGLSGGIDSALSCTLAVRAIGADNVFPLIMPYGELNEKAKEDALSLINNLAIQQFNNKIVDIKPLVDPILATDNSIDELRKGNIMARMRMIILYDLSKKLKALVLGTENKTEQMLGYFTRFGDEASDIEPIVHLYKTQVNQMAKYLKLPDKIIDQPPTAGFWEGQTDEGEFGFSYNDADRILNFIFDNKMDKEEIIKKGFSKDLVEKILERIERNRFKHLSPYTLF